MAQIHCPDCGAVIPSRNINIQKMMAVCEQCDSVFQVEDRVSSKTKLRKIKPPENFDVVEGDNTLEISYLYRKNLGGMEQFVVVMTTIGLLGAGGMALRALSESSIVGLLVTGTVALLALWVLVSYLINRAHITVEDDKIRFYETPIYGFSNRVFNRDDVERVYCAPADGKEVDAPGIYQRITLVNADGTEQNLMNYVQRHIALYVVQMVQEYVDRGNQPALFIDEDSENSENDEDDVVIALRLSDQERSTKSLN